MKKNNIKNIVMLLFFLIFLLSSALTVSATTYQTGVVAWGDNIYGETNIPAGLKDVKAIAAGWYYQ